jgi:hypothetical protein
MAYFNFGEVDDLIKRSKGRIQRIFRNARGWHMLTREGMTMGPYDSKEAAEETLREHFEDTVVPSRPHRRPKDGDDTGGGR